MRSEPVLICRPGARAVPLAEAIESLGHEVEDARVMALEALPESQAMRNAWLDFDQFERVIVTSPFAAECLAEALDRYWPQLPVGVTYYAVGPGTGAALYQALAVRVHVPAAGRETSSESLLALPTLQNLQRQRILLVTGEGGRNLLAQTLSERGARLTELCVYRRRLLEPSGACQQRLRAGNFHALVVSSGEILQHLARWCSPTALDQPLIVSSQRLATLAGKLGFRVPVVASGATPAALAAAVERARDPEEADVDHDDLEKG
ncbi:uroporphyrinogen-III synthase [Halomonas sp. 18H]|uniref:uroporphyrinogen-III synthase n=1 Tax=Halomonas almeriensis TaxID=308163 RepID=UPI00222E696F|nr:MULTISPECIES: uroporphyrinogen-III synthase [Halomonas]MCW4151953.1 uroporphyrinogen-III synthase [Halomonas sp. 18H]MDN3552395.1 uroporphyrinogen-III synthase [Halomonas almeriensis]